MFFFYASEHPNSYTGAMALAFSLAEENLEIKLEFSKRLFGSVLSRPNAPSSFVKQVNDFLLQTLGNTANLIYILLSYRQAGKSALHVC